MQSRYASRTKVSIDASRSEIERYLRKREVTEYISGFTAAEASVQFCIGTYRIRMTIPLLETVRGKSVRIEEREERARWRALLLVLKAKFAAVDSRVTTLEVEFLPYLVRKSGETIRDAIAHFGLGMFLDGETQLALPSGER